MEVGGRGEWLAVHDDAAGGATVVVATVRRCCRTRIKGFITSHSSVRRRRHRLGGIHRAVNPIIEPAAAATAAAAVV